MKALFIGSISVLADTSDLQRRCFNAAFEQSGLPWNWSQDQYRSMLTKSGGRDRIAAYAREQGADVDAAAVHQLKTRMFEEALRKGDLALRPRTRALLAEAQSAGLPVAFVSGTAKSSLDALLEGFGGPRALGIDLVTSDALGLSPKPSPALYLYALVDLEVLPRDVLVIEDNRPGIEAAKAAGLTCKAYPNENTMDHDFSDVEVLKDAPEELAA